MVDVTQTPAAAYCLEAQNVAYTNSEGCLARPTEETAGGCEADERFAIRGVQPEDCQGTQLMDAGSHGEVQLYKFKEAPAENSANLPFQCRDPDVPPLHRRFDVVSVVPTAFDPDYYMAKYHTGGSGSSAAANACSDTSPMSPAARFQPSQSDRFMIREEGSYLLRSSGCLNGDCGSKDSRCGNSAGHHNLDGSTRTAPLRRLLSQPEGIEPIRPAFFRMGTSDLVTIKFGHMAINSFKIYSNGVAYEDADDTWKRGVNCDLFDTDRTIKCGVDGSKACGPQDNPATSVPETSMYHQCQVHGKNLWTLRYMKSDVMAEIRVKFYPDPANEGLYDIIMRKGLPNDAAAETLGAADFDLHRLATRSGSYGFELIFLIEGKEVVYHAQVVNIVAAEIRLDNTAIDTTGFNRVDEQCLVEGETQQHTCQDDKEVDVTMESAVTTAVEVQRFQRGGPGELPSNFARFTPAPSKTASLYVVPWSTTRWQQKSWKISYGRDALTLKTDPNKEDESTWDGDSEFYCDPDSDGNLQVMSGWIEQWNCAQLDSVFTFQCTPQLPTATKPGISHDSATKGEGWSGKINAMGARTFQYVCPNGGLLRGIKSWHDDSSEDRVFRALCWESASTMASESSQLWVRIARQTWAGTRSRGCTAKDFQNFCPDGMVMNGFKSLPKIMQSCSGSYADRDKHQWGKRFYEISCVDVIARVEPHLQMRTDFSNHRLIARMSTSVEDCATACDREHSCNCIEYSPIWLKPGQRYFPMPQVLESVL